MIIRSTPSAITWQTGNGDVIKFLGEWTLEPAFYLSKEFECTFTRHPGKRLSGEEISNARREMIVAARAKGWIVRDDV